MKTLHASTFGDPRTADPSASSASGAEESSSREKIRHMRDRLMSKLYGGLTV